MKISILRQRSIIDPFYMKMRGGNGYYGNIHYFTFFGMRLVVNTIKKK